ncbi:MAG: hypothetical protein PUF78_09545 [Lachnospiraceae bacterium]|nr:hypothetical protein [Lachnospiraceae bacterium]
MIAEKDLLSLEFYKKSAYTGSAGKMCFRIEQVEVPAETAGKAESQKEAADKAGSEKEPTGAEEKSAKKNEEKPIDAEDQPVEMVKRLKATIWKGPYAFAHTKEKKTSHLEAFSSEGISAICQWLNEEAEGFNH